MLICPVCGKMNPQGSRNCDVCGAPLAGAEMAPAKPGPAVATAEGLSGPICPVCKRTNRSASVFCAFCGYRLKAVSNVQPYVLPYASAPPSAPSTPTHELAPEVSGNLPYGTLLKRRYRIMRKVAQGGMGAVYESSDLTAPGARWAVKEISPAALPPSERTQAIADFRREAQMLATLHHPNLPQVVETFEEKGKYFLVMEFIPGSTLLNVIEGTPGFLPEERIMVWARQLFDVLQYLHAQDPPIIYRDLKPSNIMLVEGTERVKLIDFGIARFHRSGKARDTEAFGTAGYAPPEQYGKGQTDQRSDIYALAATLHYLATKHDPSLNPFNWLPARHYNLVISPRLESALQRALELDPTRRFTTIDSFAQALGIWLPGTPAKEVAPQQNQQVPSTHNAPTTPTAPPVPIELQPRTTVMPSANGASQQKTQKKRSQAVSQPKQPTIAAQAASAAAMQAASATEIHTPTHTGSVPEPTLRAPAKPAERKQSKKQEQAPASALVVSDRLVDLGEVRWNSKPGRKISVRSAKGEPLKGTVVSSQPWIAYNPHAFQGNAVTLEVKVRKNRLPFGRTELQVPNLFAIIWARTRGWLPFIGCWFWLLLLVASSLGRTLLYGLAAVVGGLLLVEGAMWLWAAQVRLLVPAEKASTGRLLVKSAGGAEEIEVRATARPSWVRKAFGWTVALLLLTAEVAATAWIVLALVGVEIPLPGL